MPVFPGYVTGPKIEPKESSKSPPFHARIIEKQFIAATQQSNQQNPEIISKGERSRRVTWRPPPRSWIKINTNAIRRALIAAKNLNLEKVIVESDNLILIQAIKSKSTTEEANSILQDIAHLSAEIPNCGFTWTPRDGNAAADLVVRLAADENLHPNWSSNPPLQVLEILHRELLGGLS
ncbi:hypothetical protein PIB30_043054 [Stylosanthes scabra]|uniref:RNase H type-1 domain-containing protein n=1 Tax=Stylosanthes scabra TaxID=79078 RepID=A0ABU6QGX8_9FABA|nr:hypothetical protein [Stylosanthes scabra]